MLKRPPGNTDPTADINSANKNTAVSRRRFLQTTALASVGLAVPWKWTREAYAATESGLLEDLVESQFSNVLPNPLDPSFIFQGRGSRYEIGTEETTWDVLGIPGKETTVWGYKNNLFPDQGPSYPGRTFQAFFRRGSQVRWTNNLPSDHLLPVDKTVHWAEPEETGRLLDPLASAEGLESVIVTHLHGGRNQTDSDGLPEYWFGPDFGVVGPRWTKRDYVYPNEFEARTLWYHDHALGITRLNVYAGLAGFYILRDDADTGNSDNPLNLPAFPYEVPIVIQDRCFDANGQLLLPSSPSDLDCFPTECPSAPNPTIVAEFFGDVIVVNGKAWPKLEVEPRNYRLRFLNGSDSRFYILKFQDEAGSTDFDFHVIGTDQGLLFEPVPLTELLIGPGERYDVVFDFDQAGIGSGAEVFLRNFGPDEPFGGGDFDPADPDTTGQIMLFDVAVSFDPDRPDTFDPSASLPSAPIDPDADLGTPVTIRRLGLFEGEDNFGRLLPLLGAETEPDKIHALTWLDSPTENPGVGDVEEWEIYNTTEDAHPIHLHLVRFQIVSRESFELQEGALADEEITLHDETTGTGKVLDLSLVALSGEEEGPEDYEAGWKDTAVFPPGHVTRIRARFDRPGRYVWHCHILSHEDHEMMRPYYVGPIPPGE
jgi:FtsP/CotA-like multicopper oxidase with cupredoxin domain